MARLYLRTKNLIENKNLTKNKTLKKINIKKSAVLIRVQCVPAS